MHRQIKNAGLSNEMYLHDVVFMCIDCETLYIKSMKLNMSILMHT